MKNSFRNTIDFKHLDPDLAQHFVGPDLGPNFLQNLSAEDKRRQRVKLLGNLHVFLSSAEILF